MSLANAALQTIVCTCHIDEARYFYQTVLGLPLLRKAHGATVFAVGAGELRLTPVPAMTPFEHTLVGFAVDDARKSVAELRARGATFERFPTFPHDPDDLVRTPDNALVAWLRDPDGNLLSIVQFSA